MNTYLGAVKKDKYQSNEEFINDYRAYYMHALTYYEQRPIKKKQTQEY